MKKVQDHYFQQAKKDGYAARSVYKLEEIDQKYQILRSQQCVLELGCCPGSWLQYTAKRIGSSGKLVGLDLKSVTVILPKWVTVVEADVFSWQPELDWQKNRFDVILSDMSPQTSGIKSLDADRSYALNQQSLYLARITLKTGGSLLVKAFQGASLEKLKTEFRQQFAQTKVCKPKSSRAESVEIFLLGIQQKKQALLRSEQIE